MVKRVSRVAQAVRAAKEEMRRKFREDRVTIQCGDKTEVISTDSRFCTVYGSEDLSPCPQDKPIVARGSTGDLNITFRNT